jgi:regulator of RNase E activity RraA
LAIGFRINKRERKVDDAIVAKYREIAVANISDSMSRMTHGCARLRPLHSGGVLAGVALTVKQRPGDNLMVHAALNRGAPGDVLVVDAGGDLGNAVVGGILSFYAAHIGVVGVVIDGAIRDVAEIRAREFPVYARGVTHRGPYKDGPGEINVPISVGGMVVNPGDIVVGDQDGLMAFAPDEAELLIEKARAHLATEAETIRAMKEGRWDRAFIDALEARCAN